jgi:UrcA family protein
MPRTLVFATLSAIALCAAPAFAQDESTTQLRQVEVRYGDLDVYSQAGADALIRRIGQASDQVCGERSGPSSIQEHNSVNTCRTEVTENAISDVGNSVVTARYYGYQPQVIIESENTYVDPNAVVVVKKPG